MNFLPCRSLVIAALLAGPAVAFAQQPEGRGKMPPPPAVPAGVKAQRNLAYVVGGHERQVLDLFVPENAAKPLPLIIWIHGGGWTGGDKGGCPPLRQGYAQNGYAIASLNYRLSQHAIFRRRSRTARRRFAGCAPTRRSTISTPTVSRCGGVRRADIWWRCSAPAGT